MAGMIVGVDPKGTYLRTNQDRPHAATSVTLASLHLVAGDYVALIASGSFSAGRDYPSVQTMCACFFGTSGAIAAPAYGIQAAVATLPTGVGGLPTDIREDFAVPFDKKVIVRIPSGAVTLQFTVNDSYFQDNISHQLQVTISAPNKKAPGLQAPLAGLEAAGTGLDDAEPGAVMTAGAAPSFPAVQTVLRSPFMDSADLEDGPQWRSWYVSGYHPEKSTYHGIRQPPAPEAPHEHGGWDIFTPAGTTLIAPVGPAQLVTLSNPLGFGTIAALRFSRGGEKLTLVYGHVDRVIGTQPRVVQAGEAIAVSGCSGNAVKEECGKELPGGGYSDHVHIGLYAGANVKPEAKMDPAEILADWTITTGH